MKSRITSRMMSTITNHSSVARALSGWIIVWAILLCGLSAVGADTRLSVLADRCSEAGWSEQDVQQMTVLISTSEASGVPIDSLYGRIQEGMAKRAAPAKVLQAAQQRADVLDRAAELTASASCSHAVVMQSVGLALESGVSEATLQAVLAKGADYRPGQLRSVIEIGETLHLNGMSDEAVQGLMLDFLKRNLRRGEMIRAARIAQRDFGDGVGVQCMREGLWGAGQRSGSSGGTRGSGSGTGYGNRGSGHKGSTK